MAVVKRTNKTKSINSNYIKLSLLAYYRYVNKFIYVCTEAINYADVIALKKDKLVEIEVKVSKSDLKADFHKPKHRLYLNAETNIKTKPTRIIPNEFYFCTTRQLQEDALQLIKEYNNNYGLMICDNIGFIGDNIKVIKKAKPLHNQIPKPTYFEAVAKRMSNMIINFMKENK